MSKIIIRQTRSVIGKTYKQKRIMEALGLKGIGSTIEHNGTPNIVGMVNKVAHLLEVK